MKRYGSTVAPRVIGGSNKLTHNVVGGIGVVEGMVALYRSGLFWETNELSVGLVA